MIKKHWKKLNTLYNSFFFLYTQNDNLLKMACYKYEVEMKILGEKK